MSQQSGLILQYCILSYLTIQVAYLWFFSLAGKIARVKTFQDAQTFRRIRVFIHAYKEDEVIIATAKNALKQDYPSHLLEVVIIADSFSPATLRTLYKLPVIIVEVSFEKKNREKALKKAIDANGRPVDIVVVLDADNHMAPGFLHAVNDAFEEGYDVVQGHRITKKFQTSFAFLNACTEEINNHIFRRGHVAVGLPPALIDSGMAFDWNLFVSLLRNIGDTSWEDRELEFGIVRQMKKVAFLDGEFIYDEKAAKSEVLSRQRSRWLATRVEFFEKYFVEGWVQLFKGNMGFFNKVFQSCLLPGVMLVTLAFLWLAWAYIFSPQFLSFSISLFIVLVVSLLMGIPVKWYKQLLIAFLQIPAALLSMLKITTHVNKAHKEFIHTTHAETDFNNN